MSDEDAGEGFSNFNFAPMFQVHRMIAACARDTDERHNARAGPVS
jgi:hypothetical protein